MIDYESVKHQTTQEYFNGNQFSIDAFNKKYRLDDTETYVQTIKRVCDGVASVENTKELREYWSNRWFDEIYNDWWHPAGSIMQGINSDKKVSNANCTTVSMGVNRDHEEWDNLESIIRNVGYTVAKTAAYRQGLGVDFSRLRPTGTSILNSANESTGPTHWMKLIDSLGYFVGQKGRIPAMLFSLSCSHPDIEQFITLKTGNRQIQNANISVQCTDDFYKAVKKDKNWELTFTVPKTTKGQKVYIDCHSATKDCLEDKQGHYYVATHNKQEEVVTKTVKAREVLELIAKHMWMNGEPGIQNIDLAKKWSNSDYVYDEKDEYDSKIVSSNACSEQFLSRDSLCILSSINMGKFSTNQTEYNKELDKVGHSINRFLDNVNTVELRDQTYATPFQRISINKLRRTGAGLTNVAEWLLKQGLEYGHNGNKKVGKFVEQYNYQLYKSSIEIGKEKGNFGLFNRKKLEQSPFIKHMMDLGLKFTHLRNITCSSIAPTGTLSLMFRRYVMSYGIEPPFGLYYWKRTRISGQYEYYFCVPQIVIDIFAEKGYKIPINSNNLKDTFGGKYGQVIAKYIDEHKNDVGINIKQSTDVLPSDKLALMSAIMPNVDSSISTTYMMDPKGTWQDIYDLIIKAHSKGLKSITALPDSKIYGIVSPVSFAQLAQSLTDQNITIDKQNFNEEEFKTLYGHSKTLTKDKRPRELKCNVHHTTIKGQKYFVLVGLWSDNSIYEVFAGKNGFLSSNITEGKIIRKRKNFYKAVFDNNDMELSPITAAMSDTEETLSRMISLSLRSNADIHLIVQQLEKIGGEDLYGFARCIARVLKKYIPNNTQIEGITCPECNNGMVRQDGCPTCMLCGYSKCL